MDLNTPGATLANLPKGTPFSILELGAEAYEALSPGDAVTLVADDGEVTGTVSNVSIGPLLGLAANSAYPHYSTVSRTYDPKLIARSIEAKYPVADHPKAHGLAALYTQVVLVLPIAPPSFVPPAA